MKETNEIHIFWFMLCAGVTFQLALVCARKYVSWVQLLNLYLEYFKNHPISSQVYYFNNYVFVATDIIIFPGTCYVLVSTIQLALACARRKIWWVQIKLRSKLSTFIQRTNDIHISWFMLCAGVTFQLALVCARKYASWVQLLKPISQIFQKPLYNQ